MRERIAQYEAAAQQLRQQADRLAEQVTRDAVSFAELVARWRALTQQAQQVQRSATDTYELTRLEREIPLFSHQNARLREQWTRCIAAAREQEDAADHLRAKLHPQLRP